MCWRWLFQAQSLLAAAIPDPWGLPLVAALTAFMYARFSHRLVAARVLPGHGDPGSESNANTSTLAGTRSALVVVLIACQLWTGLLFGIGVVVRLLLALAPLPIAACIAAAFSLYWGSSGRAQVLPTLNEAGFVLLAVLIALAVRGAARQPRWKGTMLACKAALLVAAGLWVWEYLGLRDWADGNTWPTTLLVHAAKASNSVAEEALGLWLLVDGILKVETRLRTRARRSCAA